MANRKNEILIFAAGYLVLFVMAPCLIPVAAIDTAVVFACAKAMTAEKSKHICTAGTAAIAIIFILSEILIGSCAGKMETVCDRLFADILCVQVLPDIALPFGVAFVTFQSIWILADIHDKRLPECPCFTGIGSLLVFVPLLAQGPMMHYDEYRKKLAECGNFSYERLCMGLQLALWGAVKISVLGWRVGVFTDVVFSDPEHYHGFYLVIASVLCVIRCYACISGVIDIGRGIAQIIGMDIKENCLRPYLAYSVTDFCRRWNCSLFEWSKENISGRFSTGRENRGNSAIVFAACVIACIWYGFNVPCLIFAAYIALFVMLENAMNINKPAHPITRVIRTLAVLIVISFGMLLLHGDGAYGIIMNLKNLPVFNVHVLTDGDLYEFGLSSIEAKLTILVTALVVIVGMVQEKGIVIRKKIATWNICIRWAVYIAGILLVVITGVYGINA